MTSTLLLHSTDVGLQQNLRMQSLNNNRHTEDIIYNDCTTGLGIKIIGGCSDDEMCNFGIFVKRILPGGLAAEDGRLHEHDQILQVNGQSFFNVTNEEAVHILRSASASNYVHLEICRDSFSREEYKHLREQHFSSSGSECNSVSPRSLTYDSSNQLSQQSPTSQGHAYTEATKTSPRDLPEINQVLEIEETTPNVVKMASATNGPAAAILKQHKRLKGQPAMSSTPQYPAENMPELNFIPAASKMSPTLTSPREDPSPVLPSASLHRTKVSDIPHLEGSLSGYAQDTAQTPGHQGYDIQSEPEYYDESELKSVSIDPHIRLKVDKLQVALKYLGYEPNSGENQQLRKLLDIDEAGTVSYGDFVRAAREVLNFQLQEHTMTPVSTFVSQSVNVSEPPVMSQDTTVRMEAHDQVSVHHEVTKARQERDQMAREVERLKALVKERERSCSLAEEELLRVRREAQGAIHESRSLRSKVHLAEQAQRAARNMEQDYEEVVRLLENELAQVRAASNNQMMPTSELITDPVNSMQDNPAVQKRMAVLGTQLRKSEVSKKTYEVATEKLLHFAETVHSTLSTQSDRSTLTRSDKTRGDAPKGSQPPSYLGQHKRSTTQSLAEEAREVVRAVKSLIDVDPLPFGWDEAYTADGVKYYINHMTQTTSWTHPVSNMEHLPNSRDADNYTPQENPST